MLYKVYLAVEYLFSSEMIANANNKYTCTVLSHVEKCSP